MIEYKTDVFSHHTAMAVDQIDAALFSGDEFLKIGARVQLRRMFRRWEKQLAELSAVDMEAHGLPREEADTHGLDDDGVTK